jgi:hypothetical protein
MDMKKPSLDGDAQKKAKLEVLEELRGMAMGLMGDKMTSHFPEDQPEGMEVSVQAEDPESLKEGLDMAQDISSEMPGLSAEGESDDDMPLEEIEAMIRDLEEKRREKLAQG